MVWRTERKVKCFCSNRIKLGVLRLIWNTWCWLISSMSNFICLLNNLIFKSSNFCLHFVSLLYKCSFRFLQKSNFILDILKSYLNDPFSHVLKMLFEYHWLRVNLHFVKLRQWKCSFLAQNCNGVFLISFYQLKRKSFEIRLCFFSISQYELFIPCNDVILS